MPQTEIFRPAPGALPERPQVPDRYKWNVSDICRDWTEWNALYRELADLLG